MKRVSRNAELQTAILEKARAELVVKYRANPKPWPDGIDSKSDRWYGDGSAWTAERINVALDKSVFEGKPRLQPKPKLVVTETAESVKPWKAAGVSRATWFRQQAKEKPPQREPGR